MFGQAARPGCVLITGASSGVGEALAIECARRGVRHLFLCGRNAGRLAAVVERCKKEADGAIRATRAPHPSPPVSAPLIEGRVLDVTDAAATREWIEACNRTAPLEVVFSNAGIGTGIENEENVRKTFATNVGGGLNVVLPAIDLFRRNPLGADGRPRRRQRHRQLLRA